MTPMTPVIDGLSRPVVEFAKHQPEYRTLPALRTDDGTVVSRWRLTWRERLRVAWTGDLWLSIMTFQSPLQPSRLDTQPPLDLFDQGAP